MSSAYESVYNMHTQQPMSRTDQYRKVMKPMLERKRRARINRCLDELKELMVSALATEGENVQKLEKADILEMTVQHLQKLKQQKLSSAVGESDRFRAGFRECALEVSRCLSSIPGVDIHLGTKLMTYLGNSLKQTDTVSPLVIRVPTPPCSPADSVHYSMPLTPSSSRSSANGSPAPDSQENVWRPW